MKWHFIFLFILSIPTAFSYERAHRLGILAAPMSYYSQLEVENTSNKSAYTGISYGGAYAYGFGIAALEFRYIKNNLDNRDSNETRDDTQIGALLRVYATPRFYIFAGYYQSEMNITPSAGPEYELSGKFAQAGLGWQTILAPRISVNYEIAGNFLAEYDKRNNQTLINKVKENAFHFTLNLGIHF